VASRFGGATDFAALARAFGVEGVTLGDAPDWGAALDQALSRPGPALVHARVDAEAMVFPMVPPGAANREMLTGHPTGTGEERSITRAASAG